MPPPAHPVPDKRDLPITAGLSASGLGQARKLAWGSTNIINAQCHSFGFGLLVIFAQIVLKGRIQKGGRFVCVCFFEETRPCLTLSHGDFPKTNKFFTQIIDDGDSEFAIGEDAPFRNCTIPVPIRGTNSRNLQPCQLSCVEKR